eukprot:2707249-Alexandrium_andersonii.AAC.1
MQARPLPYPIRRGRFPHPMPVSENPRLPHRLADWVAPTPAPKNPARNVQARVCASPETLKGGSAAFEFLYTWHGLQGCAAR